MIGDEKARLWVAEVLIYTRVAMNWGTELWVRILIIILAENESL